MTKTAQSPAKAGALHEFVEVVKTVVYALAIALVLRVLLFQPFTIPSASMQPNLLEGDYIIVSKYAYGWSHHSIPFSPPIFSGRVFGHAPKRGDVIVFKLPRDGRTDYVKRLIGLPGDRIDVRGGEVFLNGKPIPREVMPSVEVDSGYGFVRNVQRFRETLPEGVRYVTYDYGADGEMDNVGGFIVPEGHYFFMGDNRDNSLDSRAPSAIGVGYVPAENLVGRAEIILLSWKQSASIFKPWTWVMDARPGRFFRLLK
ncbi:MAG: signal peptidase I [Phenylobacterium sp.]|uniref:signal peptidase I n=1 Tax=Phenylobacterium sp. TaxID=1871053 RepID=UPI0027341B25|nr:signal peptidase I [Phenylobacterium sp.]MDP3173653.1 signal peptidase I [Phenylobacterium sp.]